MTNLKKSSAEISIVIDRTVSRSSVNELQSLSDHLREVDGVVSVMIHPGWRGRQKVIVCYQEGFTPESMLRRMAGAIRGQLGKMFLAQ
jgi:hypothetical protein